MLTEDLVQQYQNNLLEISMKEKIDLKQKAMKAYFTSHKEKEQKQERIKMVSLVITAKIILKNVCPICKQKVRRFVIHHVWNGGSEKNFKLIICDSCNLLEK